MDLIDYANDPKLEVEGAEIPVDKETTLIIARWNNGPFRKMQERLTEPYSRLAGKGGINQQDIEKILNRCLAKHILLGWRGLKLEGKEIKYSHKKALELLCDERLVDFKERVLMYSQQQQYYRLETLEEDLGNSKRSSATALDGKEKSKSSSKK